MQILGRWHRSSLAPKALACQKDREKGLSGLRPCPQMFQLKPGAFCMSPVYVCKHHCFVFIFFFNKIYLLGCLKSLAKAQGLGPRLGTAQVCDRLIIRTAPHPKAPMQGTRRQGPRDSQLGSPRRPLLQWSLYLFIIIISSIIINNYYYYLLLLLLF